MLHIAVAWGNSCDGALLRASIVMIMMAVLDGLPRPGHIPRLWGQKNRHEGNGSALAVPRKTASTNASYVNFLVRT